MLTFVTLYLIETFLTHLQTEQTQIRQLLLALFAYGIMIRYDPTLVDLTSNVFVLRTNVNIYLYDYS